MHPRVSIITPSYNSAETIDATLASVRAQTFADWEMLVVDDCSTDDSAARVAAVATLDPRIRLLRQAKNGGPAAARNRALAEARGDFVAFLDADDLWLPEKLARQLAFMLRTGCALSYTAYRRIDQAGQTTGRLITVPPEVTYRALLAHNVIACLTAMVDVRQTGPLRMRDAGYDDFILWLELLRRGYRAMGLDDDLARYRIMAGSVSRNRPRAARWVWHIHREVEGLPLLAAAWTFARYAVNVSLKHRRF